MISWLVTVHIFLLKGPNVICKNSRLRDFVLRLKGNITLHRKKLLAGARSKELNVVADFFRYVQVSPD